MSIADIFAASDRIGYLVFRVLITTLWQSSILFVCAAVLVYFLRNRRETVRYSVWVAAILAMPILPLIVWGISGLETPRTEIPVLPAYSAPQPAPIARPSASANLPVEIPIREETASIPMSSSKVGPAARPRVSANPVIAETSDSAFSIADYPWAPVLFAYVLIAGMLLTGVLAARFRIRFWIVGSDPVMDERVLDVFGRVKERLGISREIIIVENGHTPAPMTCRTIHPVIVLPYGFGDGCTDDELRAVAVHELSHVMRNDMLILTLVSLVRAVFFFHPFVWLAAREVSYCAESACDSTVLEFAGDPVSYAGMLARMAKELPSRVLTTELAAGIVFSESMFLRRVKAILSDNRARIGKLSRIAIAGIFSTGILTLFVAVALPLGEAREKGETVTVTGMVDYDGKPVAGIDVYFLNVKSDKIEKVSKSDDSGSFSFTIKERQLADDERSRAVVLVYGRNNAIGWTPLADGFPLHNVLISLSDPEKVSGIVTDEKGNPVKGADVYINSLYDPRIADLKYLQFSNPQLSLLKSKTDGKGSFEIDNLPSGCKGLLSVYKPGYTHDFRLLADSGARKVEITLKPEGRIKGRIVREDTGVPEKNVTVFARNNNYMFWEIRGETDREGRYELTNIPEGVFTLFVLVDEKEGQQKVWSAQPRRHVVVNKGETVQNIDMTLVKGGLVKGRIIDADTGEPISYHYIGLHDPELSDYYAPILHTVTDGNGSFAFRYAPGEVRLVTSCPTGYVPPDWYEQGRAVDDHRVKRNATVSENQTTDIDFFAFRRGINLTGKLTAPDGTPVSGALVIDLSRERDKYEVKKTLSDNAGAFTFYGRSPGETMTLMSVQPYLKIRGKKAVEIQPDVDVELQLEPYATANISGRLIDFDNNPIPGATISLEWFGEQVGPGGGTVAKKTTDKAGRYEFENLIVGDLYYIMPEIEGYGATLTLKMEDIFTAEHDMPPHKDILIPKGSRYLEGHVLDTDDNPVAGVVLYIQGGFSAHKQTVTDGRGYYRFDNLVDVVLYDIIIRNTDYGDWIYWSIPTNETRDFILINPPHSIAGKVVDADNMPIEKAFVSITPDINDSGRHYERVATDDGGSFVLPKVMEDTVTLTVFVRGKGAKTFESIPTDNNNLILVFDKPDERPQNVLQLSGQGVVMLEDEPAPELEIDKWINGKPVKIADLGGVIAILDFIKSDEMSISREIRKLEAYNKAFREKGAVFVGILEHTTDIGNTMDIIKAGKTTVSIAVDEKPNNAGSLGKTYDLFGINDRRRNIIVDRSGNTHVDIPSSEIEVELRNALRMENKQ